MNGTIGSKNLTRTLILTLFVIRFSFFAEYLEIRSW